MKKGELFVEIPSYIISGYKWIKESLRQVFFMQPNLYSKYKNESLAIINNSACLQEAQEKGLKYNIPLIYIVVRRAEEEKVVFDKLLNCFEIAQFLNQSFLVYGEIQSRRQEIEMMQEQNERTLIKMIKRGKVYAEVQVEFLETEGEDALLKKLQELRNLFYDEPKKQVFVDSQSEHENENQNFQNT